jgi:hypothetical protein
MSSDEPTRETEKLHSEQMQRESEELTRLDDSELPDEAKQHERRAEKSAYLRQKLEERAESEREDGE